MGEAPTAADLDLASEGSEICALWQRNLAGYNAESARQKLSLGYLQNPAGSASVIGLRFGGRVGIQGTVGIHPRRMWMGERLVAAANLADFAVDREHRALGPAILLLRTAVRLAEQRFALSFGCPNPNAAPIFRVAKMALVGHFTRFAKPLTSRLALEPRLGARWAKVVAPLLDVSMWVLDGVRRLLAPRLSFREADWHDEALLMPIWQRRPAHLLMGDRSPAMLRWRFVRTGGVSWRLFVANDRAGRARGWVIWRALDGHAHVGDFYSDAPDQMTTALMLAFSCAMRRIGMLGITVEHLGGPAVARQLGAAGYIKRPQVRPVYINPQAHGRLALSGVEAWYLTGLEDDTD